MKEKMLYLLVEKGAVKPRLVQTMSLDQTEEAQELSETGGTHNKLIVKVAYNSVS